MMSAAVQLTPQSSAISAPNVAHAQARQRHVRDIEDQWVAAKRPPVRHCNQEFLTRVGVLPRMPVDPTVGPVGTGGSAAGGALIGFGLGLLIWGPLGITSLAVTNHYHSVVRGVLFLAVGIPGFTAIGAAIGACVGGDSKDI
jgi:hypothetical protein